MDLSLLARGAVIGFGIAAPVGPIGLLCIQRTLDRGRSAGLASGLGAASADAVYGLVAAFGLTLVIGFLVAQKQWLAIGGGVFLIYLGIRTLASRPAQTAASAAASRSLLSEYASTFVLTLTNPMTILAFVAIFAGAGLGSGAGSTREAALLVLGVFLGSATWWLLLSTLVSVARDLVTLRTLQWVNRAAGAILVLFGAYAMWTVLGA